MIQTLTAGTAVMLFAIAFVAFVGGGDRIAGFAVLAGLVAESVAVLAHVSGRRND